MIDIEFRSTIDSVKDRVDIVSEIGQRIELKPNKTAHCPFHSPDDDPSFSVNAKGQFWHCFACGKGGDVIRFIELFEKKPFYEVLIDLANQTGVIIKQPSPEGKQQIEEQRTITDILAATTKYYHTQIADAEKAKRFLRERKITDESIDIFQVGYADGSLRNHLLKEFSQELCLKAGIIQQSKDGIIRDFFYNRITFPHLLHGQTVNMTGRIIGNGKEDKAQAKDSEQYILDRVGNNKDLPKHIHLRGEKKHLYNEEAASEKNPVIVEGIFDVIALEQKGLPAVALLGTTLKPEHVNKFSNCDSVTLMFDDDEAGKAAILKVGKQFGLKAKILALKEGEDPDDYANTHAHEAIERQIAKLPDFYTYWIHQINNKTNKKDLPKELEPILRQLSSEEDVFWEPYLNDLKEYFELSPKEKTAYGRQIVRFHEEQISKEKATKEKKHAERLDHISEPKSINYLFHPALTIDRTNQRILVGIPKQIPSFVNGKVEYEERLTMLCNTGEKWELVEDEIKKRGWYPESTPSFGLGKTRCSEDFISALSPTPMCDHRDHRDHVKQGRSDPYENIFLPIKNTFDHFLEFSNSAHSTIVTLWTIGTYIFDVFPAYPYLHPNGFKESGKTKLAEIITRLGFNAESASNSSASALFRTIEANRSTFLLDEAEQLTGLEKNPDLRLIFNAGYKVNNPVRRTNPNTFKVESFNIYSPKVIISINALESTLSSRAIPIIMLRTANKDIGKRKVTDNAADWQKLRDSLYTFLFHHALCIADIYDNPDYLSELNNRDEELFSPLFAIARYIDTYIPSEEPKLLPLVDQFASELIGEEEGLDDWSLWILEAIDELVTDYRPYLIKDIRIKMNANRIEAGELLDERLSNKVIGTTLRKFGFKHGKSQRDGKTYLIKRNEIENLKSRYTQTPELKGHDGHNSNNGHEDNVPDTDDDLNSNEEQTSALNDPNSSESNTVKLDSSAVDIETIVIQLRNMRDKNIFGLLPTKTISEYDNDEIPIYLDAAYDVLSKEKSENKDKYMVIASILEDEANKRAISITHLKKPIINKPIQDESSFSNSNNIKGEIKTLKTDTIINGDCLEIMKTMPDNSVDLICTDPPYGYNFMGKDWDKAVPSVSIWKECQRILKPGAFVFVMSAPRQDVLAQMIINLKNGGFNMAYTSMSWVYATGFSKAGNISNLADKRLGVKFDKKPASGVGFMNSYKDDGHHITRNRLVRRNGDGPVTPQAKALQGAYTGFSPKPAFEYILVGMKPIEEPTYLDQALKNGHGCTWLDDCRIPAEMPIESGRAGRNTQTSYSPAPTEIKKYNYTGRFPANVLVEDDALNNGIITKSSGGITRAGNINAVYGNFNKEVYTETPADSGSFSRYFSLDAWYAETVKNLPESIQKTFPFIITPKPSKSEKNRGLDSNPIDNTDNYLGKYPDSKADKDTNNKHPTIKPLKLMSYLIALGSRENETILDPFVGSGTTCLAAKMWGRKYIGIELDKNYVEIARKRVRIPV